MEKDRPRTSRGPGLRQTRCHQEGGQGLIAGQKVGKKIGKRKSGESLLVRMCCQLLANENVDH